MSAEPRTLNELFNAAVDRFREDEFLRYKKGTDWHSLTYGEGRRGVREVALGLSKLGLRNGDPIAIWSENRPEWNIADLASLAISAVDVPVYTTQARDQVEYILRDSGARAIFVSSAFFQEAIQMRERVPALEYVIAFDALPEGAESSSVIR